LVSWALRPEIKIDKIAPIKIKRNRKWLRSMVSVSMLPIYSKDQ